MTKQQISMVQFHNRSNSFIIQTAA